MNLSEVIVPCAAEAGDPVHFSRGTGHPGDLRTGVLHCAGGGILALWAVLLPVRPRLQFQLPGYVAACPQLECCPVNSAHVEHIT